MIQPGTDYDTDPAGRQLAMAHGRWVNATHSFVEFPRAAIERSVPHRFEHCVDIHAERVALRAGDQTLTYAALNRLANRLAHTLVAKLGTQNVPVAFMLEPEALPIVAILGVLKAGKIFVALDPAHPSERLGKVLSDLQARVIVSSRENLARVEDLARVQAAAGRSVEIVLIDALESDASEENLGLAIEPDQLAAIFYTSGTTGQMKGVTQSHRSLLHRTASHTNTFRICSDDREPQFYSHSVVRSLTFLDLLLNGGMVLPYDLKRLGASHLADWIVDNQITILPLSVGLLRQFVEALPQTNAIPFSSVRLLTVGGEPIARQEIVRWWPYAAPDSVFVYHMGCTEVGRIAEFFLDKDSPIPDGTIPVGYPSADKEIYLVDESGSPVEADQVGEIVVKSRYLSPGYWKKPALTQTVFRSDSANRDQRVYFSGDLGRFRPDGALEFLGRKDFRVKIRGHSVQLNEVELAILEMPNVKEVVVVARPRQGGDQRLIAYLVSATQPAPTVRDLLHALKNKLPDYMIPSIFVFLDALPRMAHGKVDRKALPAPEQKRPEMGVPFVAPRAELETQLAQIWTRVLELDRVGIDDNFFELGGDSLSAMLMILEVEKLSKETVPPDYFSSPTIAVLAEFLEQRALPTPSSSASSVAASGRRTSQDRGLPRRLLPGEFDVKKILRWAVRNVLLQLSYEQGLRWLRWIGQPAIANRLYREEREYFRSVTGSLGNPCAATADAFRTSVLSNNLRACREQLRREAPLPPGGLIDAMHASRHRLWRDLANRIDRAVDQERSRLIQFTGLEHLYRAHKLKRGTILLTYHCPAAFIGNVTLSRYTRLGSIPTVSYQVAHHMADRDLELERSMEKREAAWSANFALQGQRILAKGGIVRIVNDVTYGDGNSVRKSIGGRLYDLKPGFAELALITGATVLPIYYFYDSAGVAHMTCLPPLEPLTGAASHDVCVDHLLDQYVAFLEETWRQVPESIGWGSMRRFLTRPQSTFGASHDSTESRPI